MLIGPFADLSLAAELDSGESGRLLLSQAAAAGTAAPKPAPSFLKQAGQMFMENAQKKVIHNVNQKLQQQQNQQGSPSQLQGAPGSTTPGATIPGGTTPGATVATPASAPKQAPPCRSWVSPNERPLAAMLCIHGLGLQSNSYEFFANAASKHGIAVYAIDVRGFGSWINAGGKAKVNFDDCLSDIKLSFESIRTAHPGIPVYVLGESMGGAIALRAASMYPDLVDGLISSVPAGERFNQGKTSAKVFLNLLSGFNVTNVGSDIVNQATKNVKLKAQWTGDPLARLNLSPQELIQFQDFMNNNHEAAKKLSDMPVLFVQGNGDQLVKPEGTWELFNSVAAKDKSFFAVPGEHLIFEEAQTQEAGPRDQNFQVIASWLSTKVGRRHRRGGWRLAQGGPGVPGGGGKGSGLGGFRPGGGMGGGRRWLLNTAGLESPAQKIEAGQYDDAIAELDRIRSQDPSDARVLALLGRAYNQKGLPDQAAFLFRHAMMLGRRGGDQSRALNSYLLDMNRQGGGRWGTTTGGGGTAFPPSAKGKVYAFYANWADQCSGMNSTLNQLSGLYGDTVDIMRVDIENAGSETLVDQFNVGPIPTVVFVAPNGKVASTIIGESDYNNYDQAFRSIAQPFGGQFR
jgi:alpha-beta hydrolase superfamily lysophospholipase